MVEGTGLQNLRAKAPRRFESDLPLLEMRMANVVEFEIQRAALESLTGKLPDNFPYGQTVMVEGDGEVCKSGPLIQPPVVPWWQFWKKQPEASKSPEHRWYRFNVWCDFNGDKDHGGKLEFPMCDSAWGKFCQDCGRAMVSKSRDLI